MEISKTQRIWHWVTANVATDKQREIMTYYTFPFFSTVIWICLSDAFQTLWASCLFTLLFSFTFIFGVITFGGQRTAGRSLPHFIMRVLGTDQVISSDLATSTFTAWVTLPALHCFDLRQGLIMYPRLTLNSQCIWTSGPLASPSQALEL